MRSPLLMMLLMLMPAILMAQRSALPPQEAFDRELKKNRLGTWLVLDDDGAAWGAVVRAALDDDALVTLNLPLREALVSLGDVGAADQLLTEVVGMDAWSGLPGQARDLATRLNRLDLAARWGALSPKAR